MFNVAFVLPWKSIEEGGLAATLLQGLNVKEHLHKLFELVPKYDVAPEPAKPVPPK